MTKLKATRIKSFLEKTFNDKIDLSDIQSKPANEVQKQFLSRALAAYSLTVIASCSVEDAASSITDGFNDNGIDAIFFDLTSNQLWLVQSKFIDSGVGGIDNGDVEKYTKGVKRLLDAEFDKFNHKIQTRQGEIMAALEDSSVKIQLIFAYTSKDFSTHNNTSIQELLDHQNDTDELIAFNEFNIDKAYKGLEGGINNIPINEDFLISNWGHIDEPLKAYYGQITGTDLAALWEKYGRRLFTENIRSFLGSSDVNMEITKTIRLEPSNFIYFNNGITILCESIKKKPLGGSNKAMGAFTCNGISVVNGAQTFGSIGSMLDSDQIDLGQVKVFVKFISLEGSPEGFGHRITIATNTQNKVDKKDFISLDHEQARLKVDLKLENIDYHYKRTDERIVPDESNYSLEEVAFSLASKWEDIDYSTMVKKESGKIWDNVTTQPYTDLFSSRLNALTVIKSVKIYRYVTNKMRDLASQSEGRLRSIYLYGNSFIAHLVFQKMPKVLWKDDNSDFDKYYDEVLPAITDSLIEKLTQEIENNYPGSMIVYVLRNYSKCRQLKGMF